MPPAGLRPAARMLLATAPACLVVLLGGGAGSAAPVAPKETWAVSIDRQSAPAFARVLQAPELAHCCSQSQLSLGTIGIGPADF